MNRISEGARNAPNILHALHRVNTLELAGSYSNLGGIVTLSESNEPERIEYSGPEPDDDLPWEAGDLALVGLVGVAVMVFIAGVFALIVWVKS